MVLGVELKELALRVKKRVNYLVVEILRLLWLNKPLQLLKQLETEAPSIRIKLTGGNDLYHHNKPKSYTSLHETGGGLDFTISPVYWIQIKQLLEKY